MSGFDAAHVKNVIDYAEKMLSRYPHFLKVLPRRFRNAGVIQCDSVQSDDRIHRCPDFMAHIGQKRSLCLVCLVGLFQRNTQRFPLFRQFPHHFLLFCDIQENAYIGYGGTVRAACGFADSPVPAVPSVFRPQTVLHVIGLLTGIVGNRFIIRLQHALPVIRMQQVGPGFEYIRKVLHVLIPEHPPEFVAPVDPGHHTFFIKIHRPFAGSEHFMNGIKGRRFVLQLCVKRIQFLLPAYFDRHAPELHRLPLRVPVQYPFAAKPPGRAILSAEAEFIAFFAHDVFIKCIDGRITDKNLPVFRVNAPHK